MTDYSLDVLSAAVKKKMRMKIIQVLDLWSVQSILFYHRSSFVLRIVFFQTVLEVKELNNFATSER